MNHKLFSVAVLSAFVATAGIAQANEAKVHREHHGGKMFEKMDTNKDGKISKAESQAAHDARFTAMDANKDGSVTKEEGKAHWDKKRAEWQAKRDAATKQN